MWVIKLKNKKIIRCDQLDTWNGFLRLKKRFHSTEEKVEGMWWWKKVIKEKVHWYDDIAMIQQDDVDRADWIRGDMK